MLSRSHSLPVQRPEVMRQITSDIAMDKAHALEILGGVKNEMEEDHVHTKEEDDEEEAIAAMVKSTKDDETPVHTEQVHKRLTKLRRMKTNAVLKKHKTLLDEQAQMDKNKTTEEEVNASLLSGEDEAVGQLLKKRISTKHRYATKTRADLSKATA